MGLIIFFIVGLLGLLYGCLVASTILKRSICLFFAGVIVLILANAAINLAKLDLGVKYHTTCLNPSARILISVKADIKRGEIVTAQEKIDMLIARLGSFNHYWYDMPQINSLADKIEADSH